ncbi:unnamed protein product [Musa banksii]
MLSVMLFFDIYSDFPDKLGCMIGETSYNNFLAYFGETELSLKRYWWTRWRKDKWIFDLIINLCSSVMCSYSISISISRACADGSFFKLAFLLAVMASNYEQFMVYQSRMGQAGLLAFWQERCRCWTSHRTVRFNSSRHHSFGLVRNFREPIPTTLLAPWECHRMHRHIQQRSQS